MRRALEIIVAVALGAIVAAVGSVAYRGYPPVGVALSIALVLFATVFVRAWSSWAGLIAFAIPFVALTYLFTRQGPGGSLLIPADHLGYTWLFGSAAALVLACLIPARLIGGGKRVASP